MQDTNTDASSFSGWLVSVSSSCELDLSLSSDADEETRAEWTRFVVLVPASLAPVCGKLSAAWSTVGVTGVIQCGWSDDMYEHLLLFNRSLITRALQ